MNVFNLYSEYYNLLYKDKNYAAEADYVSKQIRKFKPGTKTILDLGCGTGKHDFLLAKKGYNVLGADCSKTMLDEAGKEKLRRKTSTVKFIESDIRKLKYNKKFDTVVSLFHVMSYQNTEDDINDVLKTVSSHLKEDGLFIFDFWYGPAVLTERPSVRKKVMENELKTITRIAEPEMDYSHNQVKVNYDIFITNKRTSEINEIKETHSMRYFFEPEMNSFLENNSFKVLEIKEWLTDAKLSSSTWNAVYICKKSKKKLIR